jgi:acyl dehydratase
VAVDTSVVGKPTGAYRVVIERGPVSVFAGAVKDDNPIFHDEQAARDAGFDAIPAPPTYSFVMQHHGKFADNQPPDPTGGEDVVRGIMGELMSSGGLILHGEEEFRYHRPIQVGDTLVGEGVVEDLYQKESKGRTMTFLVIKTTWKDEATGEPVVTERFNLIHRA